MRRTAGRTEEIEARTTGSGNCSASPAKVAGSRLRKNRSKLLPLGNPKTADLASAFGTPTRARIRLIGATLFTQLSVKKPAPHSKENLNSFKTADLGSMSGCPTPPVKFQACLRARSSTGAPKVHRIRRTQRHQNRKSPLAVALDRDGDFFIYNTAGTSTGAAIATAGTPIMIGFTAHNQSTKERNP